jgi:hypothetical protein
MPVKADSRRAGIRLLKRIIATLYAAPPLRHVRSNPAARLLAGVAAESVPVQAI